MEADLVELRSSKPSVHPGVVSEGWSASSEKIVWNNMLQMLSQNLSTQYGRIFSSLECSDPSFNMMITSLGNGSGFVRVEE